MKVSQWTCPRDSMEELMKSHRITALLCAGIMALSPAGGQLSYAYASEVKDTAAAEEAIVPEIETTGATDPSVETADDAATSDSRAEDSQKEEPDDPTGTATTTETADTADTTVTEEENTEAAEEYSTGESSAEDAGNEVTAEDAEEAETGSTIQKDPLGSLLPLEERQASIMLASVSEEDLKNVSVSFLMEHLQDPDGNYYSFSPDDSIIWSYYKDEYGETIRDEYHHVEWTDTVDMSMFKDNSAGYKMELIVGDGSQLGNNVRYIVHVYYTAGPVELIGMQFYTQDEQGKRHQVVPERSKRTDTGTELYIPGHQPGTEYYVGISSEVDYYPFMQVDVYTEEEYENFVENGWYNADPITDSILNQNMKLPDHGYKTTLDVEEDRTFVVVATDTVTHHVYYTLSHTITVRGSSVHVDSSVWTREDGRMVQLAKTVPNPNDWDFNPIQDGENGVETQKLSFIRENTENEEFYIVLTACHDGYGNEAADHITGTYEGIYDSAAAAEDAGAEDLTDKLFADPEDEAFAGFTVGKDDLLSSREFTVFWDDGSVCKIQINISQEIHPLLTEEWENYYAQPVIGEQDPWFRVTGVKLGDRELDAYVVENGKSKTLDTYYGMGYQTIFVNEYLSEADIKALKPIFWVADSDKIRIRTNANRGAEEVSGVTEHDFTSPKEYYALFEGRQKNYIVEVIPKKRGPKLYVFGADGTEYERNREIFLDEYYQYRHDILIANVGDQKLEGLSVRLENASHVKIDDYWNVGGANNNTLEPFTTVDNTTEYGELQNLAKVRVVSDGAGEIKGDLIISANGQKSVVIHLSGSAIQPVIRTTKLTYAVKYVPYSYIISTSNMNEKVDVTYELKGKLPSGMKFDAKTGELYGVPMETGTYSFTVTANFSDQSFETSTRKLTLEVKDNEDEIVFNATDEGYEIIPEENGVSGYVGEQVSTYKFELDENASSETFITSGEFSEFERLWINGVELEAGTDFVAEPGSTIAHLFLDIIRNKPVLREGRNTISVEYNIGGSNNSAGSSGTNSSSGGRNYDFWSSNGGGGGGSTTRRAAQNFWIGASSSSEPSVTRYFKISKTSDNLHKGKTLTLKISRNYTTTIAWATTNPKIAKVNKYGKVTAVGKGNCTIVAKSGDGKTQKCKIHVMIPVKTIKLNKTSMQLLSGKSATLTTTVTPSNVDKRDFVWTSSNKKIATVNASGKVTGVSKGSCTITVKTPNGKKKTCKVTVSNIIAVKSVKLNAARKTLNKWESFTLKATISPSNASNKTLKWSSSNTKVAKVSSSGKVTAVGAGKARISVKSNNGKTASCDVTVKLVPVSSIALKLDELILNKDAATKLAVEILPANASDKTTVWSSSDESVVTVSNGSVTGVGEGTAVVTVTSSNGLTASCEVRIVSADAEIPEITLSNKMIEIVIGETAALEAEMTAYEDMDHTIRWESTRPDVAEVDETGLVTTKKVGYTTILARSAYNTVATCSVRVKLPDVEVESISLDQTRVELNPGFNDIKTVKLNAQILPANATDKSVTWESADESIAIVKDGVVSAQRAGTTTVTATASNGMTAVCEVVVEEGPRKIRTAQDLINIEQNVGADYVLANDIDLSGMEWSPIGGTTKVFAGTLDGNGHTISGLRITNAGEYNGLFYFCSGTVQNLTLRGSIELSDYPSRIMIGGICGTLINGMIDECNVDVDIIYNGGSTGYAEISCGGLVGVSYNSEIYNSNYYGSMIVQDAAYAKAGGIAGEMTLGSYAYGCVNGGNIECHLNDISDESDIYGLVGGIAGSAMQCDFDSCENAGSLMAELNDDYTASENSYLAVGGIVGETMSSTFSDCSNSGEYDASGNDSIMVYVDEIAGMEY